MAGRPKARRGPGRTVTAPVTPAHPNFPLGKTPAENCACQDPDSTARFTVTVQGHILCSWCGGDLTPETT